MKKDKVITFVFIFIFLVLFLPVLFKIFFDFSKTSSNEKISTIDYYGYSLSKNDTDIYKSTYKELEKVLMEDVINYNSYASLMAKLFVIDLYTLDNKLASTDIGGVEFIHKDLRDNFKENMGSTLYNHILSNIDGNRNQNLPVVSGVNVENVFETTYEYYDVEYDAYLVKCSISYEEDLGYQNSITLTIIKVDNILYIVKGE